MQTMCTLPSLNDFGLGYSWSVPEMMFRKKMSNFLRESPVIVPPILQIKEKRKRHCNHSDICI